MFRCYRLSIIAYLVLRSKRPTVPYLHVLVTKVMKQDRYEALHEDCVFIYNSSQPPAVGPACPTLRKLILPRMQQQQCIGIQQ